MRGFLISVTAPHHPMALPPGLAGDAASLRELRVLLQSDPDYVSHLMTTLAAALDGGAAAAEPQPTDFRQEAP